ncbi:MAG: hypothetical protein Q7S65_03555 [Nanoarchaeota archaeon]|nr:hypothetical protein [Nanoarchaeota archaeon]
MGVMYLVTITFLLLPINKRVQLSVSLFLIAYTLGSWVYAIAGDFDYFKTYFFEELMAYGVLSFDLTTLVIVLMGVYLLVIGLFSTRISLRTVRWSSAIVSGLVLFFLTFYTYDLEWFDWVYLALLFFVIKVILLMHNHSKKFVKVATICMGVLSLAFLTEAIYFVYGNMVWSGSSNYDLDFILYTLRGLIPFFFVAVASLFSLLYLKKSQRVKNTFVKD